jgi:YD repeat-containing protein
MTIAGTDQIVSGFSGDGGPATQATLNAPVSVAEGPDRSIYITDAQNFRIRKVSAPLPGFTNLDFAIPSEDGSQVYQFDKYGRHLRTLNALTGATLLEFGYDQQGRLTQVQDGNGNITTIERNGNGDPLAIRGPFGQRTTLTLDANGYLASATNPAGETVQLTYTPDGLLIRERDPRNNETQFTYDALGRLLSDNDAAGGAQALSRTEAANGYRVSRSTALNRTTNYQVDFLTIGNRRQVNTFPDGTHSELLLETNGKRTTTVADGSVLSLLEGPDPRFGMQAPLPKSLTTTSGGLISTVTTGRTVSLANPNNPLSLNSLTDTVLVNGRTYTSTYAASTKTLTNRTPVGRQTTTTIDTQGRVRQTQVTGLAANSLQYDSRGRLSSVSQGGRSVTFTYDSNSYLDTVTDSLGRVTGFDHDAVGRVTAQTLPDGRVITYSYDTNGNLTALTPPGRPAHTFTYTSVDLQATYTAPSVNGGGANQTTYAYNADRQLELITRSDGKTIDINYDSAGRIASQSIERGNYGFGYNTTTGNLQSINAPGGVGLGYTYNGSLLTGTTWTGPIAGSVTRTYDNNFRVTSLSVNGANPISLTYDNDSLLTGVGAMTLTVTRRTACSPALRLVEQPG